MYKEVPFIGILEPVLASKNKFLQMERAKQTTYVIGAAVIALLLVIIQIPMRVDGASHRQRRPCRAVAGAGRRNGEAGLREGRSAGKAR